MKIKKVSKIALSTAILSSTLFISSPSSYATSDQSSEDISVDQFAQENQLLYNETIVATYNSLGMVSSETVIEEAVDMDGNVLLSNTSEVASIVPQSIKSSFISNPGYGTNAVVNPGGIDYKYMGKFNTTSVLADTVYKWVKEFAANVIPIKFFKNDWAKVAGTATGNTFLPEPVKTYYSTLIYSDRDYYNYYGKTITKSYSDSARTKLKKSSTYISRLPKANVD